MGLWEQTDVCHRNVAIVKPYAGIKRERIKADHVRGGQCEETQHLHTFMSQTLHM